ncbi:MAG TPA: cytochrome P450 [Ilumatobacteraceae bacterium]|nr:cytochrome P450 [Ilumatobacteraceae bacterium]
MSQTTATSVFELELPVLDFLDAGMTFDEQADTVAETARQSWIARNPFGFSVLHYDDVVAVLRDKRWHSASSRILEMYGIDDPKFTDRNRESILSAEGDVHTRLRRLVGKAFSPRAADRLRPFMREVVNSLVDPVAPTGRADIAVDICEPYPIPIICELLGAPKEDWQLFSRWASDVLRIFNGNLHEDLPIITAAQDELDEYTRGLIAERRTRPAEDLITDLIAAEEEGDRLSLDELVMMVEAVIIGGTDTTRNQLGCTVALFAEHPQQWKLLGERPELAPRAVEEAMRYFGAIRGTGRFASEDIEYRDILFPKGTMIMPSMSAANHDPAAFDSPGTFDITRDPPERPQLTFGSGIHYCLGAALARAELQEALPILASRMPDLAIDGAVTWKPVSVGIFGPEHLPVTFRASA